MSVRTPRLNKLTRAAHGAVMESLEYRRLLSVSFAEGVVHVVGTHADDSIKVEVFYDKYDGPEVAVARVTVNGRRQTFRDVVGIEVDARGGDDTVSVHSRNVPAGMDAVRTTLLGGSGNDELYGSLTSDSIDGGAGNDHIQSGDGGHDSLYGGDGDDMLIADHRNNVYFCSGAGNDICAQFGPARGQEVYDHRKGGGRDTSNDDHQLVDGHKPFWVLTEDGILNVAGSNGDDSILLYMFENSVCVSFLTGSSGGAAGSRALITGVRIFAGDGDDRISVLSDAWSADVPVTVLGGAGDDQIMTGGEDDVIVSGAGHDRIDGGGGSDDMIDLSPHDRITSAAGTAHQDGGTVWVAGTEFDDRIRVVSDGGDLGVWVNGTAYHFTGVTGLHVDGGAGNDLVMPDDPEPGHTQVPMTLIGGAGNDVLVGGNGGNLIDGGGGDDCLYGGAVGDTLLGGDGDDTLGPVGAGGVQLGGAGENLIWSEGAMGYWIATAGDDNSGTVERQDAEEYVPPAEYNPVNRGTDDDEPEAEEDGTENTDVDDGESIDDESTQIDPVEESDIVEASPGSGDEADVLVMAAPATVWARAGAGSMFGTTAVRRPWEDSAVEAA